MTYSVILADPPWAYQNTHSPLAVRVDKVADLPPRRNAARHYSGVLTPRALADLPVGDLAGKHAALFLWVTMIHLPSVETVMEAWGFRYRTAAFVWVKQNANGAPFLGLGNYTRANAELCLLGLRGRPRVCSHDVSQVLMARRRQHSRKPDEQYGRIMRLFDGPYLELFARQRWPGWDVWGDETAKYPAQPFLMEA